MSEALASLTATYTDSEGDEDLERQDDDETTPPDDDSNLGVAHVITTTPPTPPTAVNTMKLTSSRPSTPAVGRINSKVKKLVSYLDDTHEASSGDEEHLSGGDDISENDEFDEKSKPNEYSSNKDRGSSATVKKTTFTGIDEDALTDDEEDAEEDNSETVHNITVLSSANSTNNYNRDNRMVEDSDLLPPEPVGECSDELQEKISRLHEKMLHQQLDMNALIKERKDFRNPSIYEKLIQFCGINELGTNYPPSIYDPLKWSKESYYEELAKVQKVEMDRREKERKSKVEVISGTKKLLAQSTAQLGTADDDASRKQRRSKWDQPSSGGGGTTGAGATQQSLVKPAGLVQPTLTTAITGTKGTVISAFGLLPKKPRL